MTLDVPLDNSLGNKTEPQDAPEGRRERKKRELRERIYETARQLFLENGFEETTVEQIADAADIAQATFFNHFQNKSALLSEMTREVFNHLQVLVDRQLSRPVSAQERIIGFANSVADEIEPTHGLARDVTLELVRNSSRPGEAAPYLQRVQDPFTRIIQEGQEAGDVRTDLDAEFLVELVLGAYNVAMAGWINDSAYPLATRLRQTAAFIAEAIQPHDVSLSLEDERGETPIGASKH